MTARADKTGRRPGDGNGAEPFRAVPSAEGDRAPPLPHNLDFERSVLGGIVLRNDVLRRVELASDDFYDPRHRAVWSAMAELDAESKPIDVQTLEAQLQCMGKVAAAGGLAYFGQLEHRVPTVDNVIHYAGVVRELAERRRLRLGASRIASEDLSAQELRASLGRLVEHPSTGRQSARLAVDIIPDLAAEAALPMVPSGFGKLDNLLGGGLAARTMTELIGPTGSGKTSLAAQIGALHAESSPVLFYSGELTAAQLVARILAQRTGRSWRRVLRLELDERTMRDVLRGLNLYILGRSENPLLDIAAAAAQLAARGAGVPLAIVDYAQLVADVGENMRLAVMQSVRALHRLTETTDLAMLLLAQGSRASSRAMHEAAGSAEDYVDAGAETAQLEQAAANVIALLGSRPDGAAEWDVTAAVSKARYGRTGKVELRFAGSSWQWTELEELPTTESEKARDLEIETIVLGHPAECDCCAGKPLSITALNYKARHKVAGNKTQITASVRRVERHGRIRNEGGALLPAAAGS